MVDCSSAPISKHFAKTMESLMSCRRHIIRCQTVMPKHRPAQWIFGRRQRTFCPSNPAAFSRLDNSKLEEFERSKEISVVNIKSRFDEKTKSLLPLQSGDLVLIQDPITKKCTKEGKIMKTRRSGRSYLIQVDGKFTLRNRIYLRPARTNDAPPGDGSQENDDEQENLRRSSRP
eukprot:maker-scaffold1945_size24168-snap-gene-0.4 protein:Tk08583 transcript:maker-scaffold1945_size24168-snap-gene-0.4-mRNA-1 annotation:"hypothetical protein DAPPUDRAFT_261119"